MSENENEKPLKELVGQFNGITRRLDAGLEGVIRRRMTNGVKTALRKERRELLEKIYGHPDFDPQEKYFLVPQIRPDLFISSKVAVVGNSVTLLNHRFGDKIDSYPDVIRFNYAYLDDEYKKWVGSKTTLRMCGYPAFIGGKPKNHPPVDRMDYQYCNKNTTCDQSFVVYYRPSRLRSMIQNHRMKVGHSKKKNRVYFLDLTSRVFYVDVLKNWGVEYGDQHFQSGTVMMLLIGDLGIVPDLYGFDLKYCDDNYYYYWDLKNMKCLQLSPSHNYDSEFYLPNKLASEGRIKVWTFHRGEVGDGYRRKLLRTDKE